MNRYRILLGVAAAGLALALLCQNAAGQGPAGPGLRGKPAIYEFARPLCPICKKMEAILLEVKAQYRDQVDVRIFYMETDAHIFRSFRVTIVPSQVFLDPSGKEVFRHEGVFPKEKLLKKLRELRFIQE